MAGAPDDAADIDHDAGWLDGFACAGSELDLLALTIPADGEVLPDASIARPHDIVEPAAAEALVKKRGRPAGTIAFELAARANVAAMAAMAAPAPPPPDRTERARHAALRRWENPENHPEKRLRLDAHEQKPPATLAIVPAGEVNANLQKYLLPRPPKRDIQFDILQLLNMDLNHKVDRQSRTGMLLEKPCQEVYAMSA